MLHRRRDGEARRHAILDEPSGAGFEHRLDRGGSGVVAAQGSMASGPITATDADSGVVQPTAQWL